jgi:hypothetical protein
MLLALVCLLWQWHGRKVRRFDEKYKRRIAKMVVESKR